MSTTTPPEGRAVLTQINCVHNELKHIRNDTSEIKIVQEHICKLYKLYCQLQLSCIFFY